MERLFIN